MRIAKVRITSHRPPGQGASQPLERTNARPGAEARPALRISQPSPGLDQWDRTEAAMAAEHNRNVASYSRQTAQAALADIGPRAATGKDPESRWIRHRRAALARKLHAPELIRK